MSPTKWQEELGHNKKKIWGKRKKATFVSTTIEKVFTHLFVTPDHSCGQDAPPGHGVWRPGHPAGGWPAT